MSVLTNVEAKGWKGKTFRTIVLLMLLGGGVTMVYPFLIMFSGSLRSEMDSANLDLVPSFLVSETDLTRKFLESKYNYDIGHSNLHRGYTDYSFEAATVPPEVVPAQVEDVQQFVAGQEMPHHWWALGGTLLYKQLASHNLSRFTARLRVRYNGDLAAIGEDLGAPIAKWRHVSMPLPEWTDPRYGYDPSPFFEEYFALLRDRPLGERAFVSVTDWFLQNVAYPAYGKDGVERYNNAHARPIDSYRDFALPRRVPGPDQPRLREEWITFVHEIVNCSFVRADGEAGATSYARFLRGKYEKIDVLNQRWESGAYRDFDEITMPGDREWIPSSRRQDFQKYLASLPPERLYLVGPEFVWRDWLKQKYGRIEDLRNAHQADYASFDVVRIPLDQVEKAYVQANTGMLRRQFSLNNFRNVFEEIILQGRPFINTIIYVVLSLILCLTLQPLAAYALSRFHPPGTWRFILIFMATMAFPPMVGMIPQFLILRNFYLLNTYVALVLPVIVNGYLIFLLKGFFDSLPQHLYDAALIDGAGEIRMFLEITMALSKPILAVVALQTFNHCWLAFMYPLLVAPSEKMQVLAVWLYTFQQEAPTPAVFASILVTSIPTLLIFVVTQRTIMRGIAVPAEK